jgi:hypothetical protein
VFSRRTFRDVTIVPFGRKQCLPGYLPKFLLQAVFLARACPTVFPVRETEVLAAEMTAEYSIRFIHASLILPRKSLAGAKPRSRQVPAAGKLSRYANVAAATTT